METIISTIVIVACTYFLYSKKSKAYRTRARCQYTT